MASILRDPLRIELDRHRNDTDGAPLVRVARRGAKGKARTVLRVELADRVRDAMDELRERWPEPGSHCDAPAMEPCVHDCLGRPS